jgi:dTDP-4-amino-4,6-dideoxygalactose transaminase
MIRVFGSKVGKEELHQVEDSINNQWLGAGPKVKLFEEQFKKRISGNHFLMIDNASNGLFLACTLLELPSGSEVILPSFTWVACAHAVQMAGCKPVFCDVEYDSQNVSARTIAPLITKNTSAIMVVHYAGLPVEMKPILEFGLPVIEDAAHAVNSIYDGKYCGTLADIGVYSFDSMKNLAIGEGGGLACQNEEVGKRARELRLCGMGVSAHEISGEDGSRWWEQQATTPFIKMKPSDLAGGFAVAQLAKLDELQRTREQIWNTYQLELLEVGDLKLPSEAKINDRHSFFTFCIKSEQRDQLAKFLLDSGIYTTLRFFPIHLFDLYRTDQGLVNTEKLSETALNIPLHPSLTNNEIDLVVQRIKDFFN